MILSYFLFTISWLVAFTLLMAAWGKLKDLHRFKSNLRDSFGFSARSSKFVAPLIIVLEFLLALTTVSGTQFTYLAMVVSFVVFIVFTAFLAYHWLQNARVKCSCFGEDDRPVSVFDLLRNALIILFIGCYLMIGGFELSLTMHSQFLLVILALAGSTVVIHTHDIFMVLLTARGKV